MLKPYERPGTPLSRRYVGSSEVLECAQVRRRDRHGPAARKILEDGAAQCRSFDRIRARAKLVDQHERARGGMSQYVAEVLHVCAERRQAGRDGLLIADIGEDLVVEGDAAIRSDWRRETRADHRREEADGFEQHGLPARVGT